MNSEFLNWYQDEVNDLIYKLSGQGYRFEELETLKQLDPNFKKEISLLFQSLDEIAVEGDQGQNEFLLFVKMETCKDRFLKYACYMRGLEYREDYAKTA